MDFIIETKDLTKEYASYSREKILALDRLTIALRPGRIYGILGPNGSGKTTTMKLLLGLLKPTCGEIRVLDGQPTDLAVRAKVGFLPEESYLYRYLSAVETMRYFSQLMALESSKKDEKILQIILEKVGLMHAQNRPVKEYSKGMMRRLGLALILLKDPELVFLDEPTVGLDPLGSRDFKVLIRYLKEQKKTIFLSSHLLGEIEDLCDEIFIINKGRLIHQGSLDQLLRDPNQVCLVMDRLNEQQKQEMQAVLNKYHLKSEWTHPKKTLEQIFLDSVGKDQ